MKTYDLIQQLREHLHNLEAARDWLKEGMGNNCVFLNNECKEVREILEALEADHHRVNERMRQHLAQR